MAQNNKILNPDSWARLIDGSNVALVLIDDKPVN